jgi:hypothetical protein
MTLKLNYDDRPKHILHPHSPPAFLGFYSPSELYRWINNNTSFQNTRTGLANGAVGTVDQCALFALYPAGGLAGGWGRGLGGLWLQLALNVHLAPLGAVGLPVGVAIGFEPPKLHVFLLVFLGDVVFHIYLNDEFPPLFLVVLFG